MVGLPMSEQTAQDLLTAHLNRSQRQAVLHGEGPLLVLAGAGSGKTRVITYRIINLIRTRKIPAYHILGVTFTNKAAKEMGERIQTALTGAEQPPLITTFHALGARILRQEGHLLGYTAAFVIYDESDSERVLKDVIKSLDLDEKRFSVKVLAQHIDHYKNRGEFPEDVTPSDSWTQTVLTVYQRYQERLMKSNALDFGDLLLQTIRLFTQFPDVLAQWQERFQWLLVDEYQDTNPVQYTLIKLLAGERRNLCVVGDDERI
jgi:DNA helicase-2/ATP-dependent DNA helicase PcrA